MIELEILAIREIRKLSKEILTIHEDLMRWQDPPLDTIQQTVLSVKLKSNLYEIINWTNALDNDD